MPSPAASDTLCCITEGKQEPSQTENALLVQAMGASMGQKVEVMQTGAQQLQCHSELASINDASS